MLNFTRWLEEKKKTGSKKESSPPTITSAPLRGQNQDQSGHSDRHSTADYTISDDVQVSELFTGVSSIRQTPSTMSKGAQTTDVSVKNAPHSAGHLQRAADRRRMQLDKLAQQQSAHAQKERERQQKEREHESTIRDRMSKLRSQPTKAE